MKTRKWPLLFMAILTVLSMSSCQEWGEVDPPAGNQKLPEKPDTSAKLIAEFTFDEDFNSTATEGETTITGEGFAYSLGQNQPEIVQDDEREGGVMHANGGYLRIPNPLIGADIQTGVSFSFFVKPTKTDHTGALISFSDGTNKLYFTANAFLSYTGTGGYLDVNDPEVSVTNAIPSGAWHYVALAFTEKGYAIYIDGTKKYDTNNHASISSGKTRAVTVGDFDYANMIDLLSSATYLYIGYGSDTETAEAYYDNLKIWTNTFSDGDAQGPNIGSGVTVPDPVYRTTFETTTGLQIIGGGSFVTDDNDAFGRVFKNVGGAKRTNYLLLPEDILSHSSESKEISIGVWVNAKEAGASSEYLYAPLFMAYGAAPVDGVNTFPMFALQYRGLAQVNCAGYCDFTAVQNVTGINTEYNGELDWLADKEWHYYMATLTPTSCKIYFDGILKNEWAVDGVSDGQVVSGLFSNGSDLKYICLGGNQAWDWGDNDSGFMFDDLAIFDKELSQEQIKQIIEDKTLALPTPVYTNTFENGVDDAQIIGAGSIVSVEDRGFGQVFRNVAGSKGTNYLKLPQDVLSHSVESQEVSISVWVNAKNAGSSDDYRYSPLFTAYGNEPSAGSENIWPMFILQSRGLAQINCNGWTDFTAEQNEKGVNTVYCSEYAADGIVCEEDWLKDHEWHLYTAVLTTTTCKIYIDGEIANSWIVTGSGDGNTISGIFTNGADLKYISLGGNQAWTWADPDPGFMFDDISIYNKALSVDEVQAIMKKKRN